MHSRFPNHKEAPLIGITGNFSDGNLSLAQGYYQSVIRAGGVPLIIPPYEDTDLLINTLDTLDGILLSGGGDINPLFLGEEPSQGLHSVNPYRDRQELMLVRLAANRQIPILGICRGIQIMNAALGGSLCQDIYTEADGTPLKHSQEMDRAFASHTINIAKDSLLYRIMRTEKLPVNSFHHQAVKAPAPGFRISATAPDGIIEAIESTEHKSMLGVQWHPECFILNHDRCMMPLFGWLIKEARSFHAAKHIHERLLTLDTHCDTPMFFEQHIHFAARDPRIKVDLHKMTEGRQDTTIMVAYLPQKERTEEALLAATAKADQLLDEIEKMVAMNCTAADIAYTPADLYRLKREGKKAIMLGIENGLAIEDSLDNIDHFARRGMAYMTLCHNGDNAICDSARRSKGTHGGVSAFGAEVIRRMNDLGVMVDMSHAGEKSFYDALSISRAPIVCSHSNCRALCDVPRNLTDDQLRAIARKGGVVHITLYHGFLRTAGEASILDAIAHLEHAISIMGTDHVGIGTDFDGDGGVSGMADSSEMINFTRMLLRRRYSPEDIALIWGGNWLRVMDTVKGMAATTA